MSENGMGERWNKIIVVADEMSMGVGRMKFGEREGQDFWTEVLEVCNLGLILKIYTAFKNINSVEYKLLSVQRGRVERSLVIFFFQHLIILSCLGKE